MKVLTVQQPWASLIMHGVKRWEQRSWPTLHRGLLAIHAGRRLRAWQRHLCRDLPIERLLSSIGIRGPSDLPLGRILGVATVVDCIPACELPDDERPLLDGGFAWQLADPVMVPVPVPHRGQLGLCELPVAISAMLQRLCLPPLTREAR
jgi:activating signal cointegrator 1